MEKIHLPIMKILQILRRCRGAAKRLLINDEIIITKNCNIDPKHGGKNHNKITFNNFISCIMKIK